MPLQQILENEYRSWSLSKSGASVFRLDDKNDFDVYQGFCEITATVHTDGSFTLELRQPPLSPEVREVVERLGGTITEGRLVTVLKLELRPKDHKAVLELASGIRDITREGQTYWDRNWKWICPRTSKALRRFAKCLASAREK